MMLEDITVEFFATFLIWFLYAGLVVLWFIDGRIKKEQVIHALLASLVAWLIALLIKHFFPTIRPFILNGGEVDVLFKPTDAAFPSAHTALAFSLAVTIFMHDRRVGWFFLIGALAIGIARVLANVHYPVDILGGALIGTLVAVVVEKVHLFKLLHKRG
ncbi:MAG: phosphatase PAP2 family protein [Candidatus Woesebacteria bacterium]|nr:phosphatase PAP2 family protein [Candidatus Woesebacteria bacterium]